MLLNIFAFIVGVVVLGMIAVGAVVMGIILTWVALCAFEAIVNWFKKNFRMW